MARIADPQPAGPTNVELVVCFEKHIGYPLPQAYREFLLQHNGGRPVPDAFLLSSDRGEEEDVVMCFFPLRALDLGSVGVSDLDQLRTWPLHCAWDDLQQDLEDLYQRDLEPPLLPIGTDGSSNYISLILTGDDAGSVVFLDSETAEPWPPAPSFPAFLDSLRPRQRTDYDPLLGPGS